MISTVDPVTASTVPHRLHALPTQLAIPPQYAHKPSTSRLAQQPPGTATTMSEHVTVPELPKVGEPALSHQSRFFFRGSPEQIDPSPDRATTALEHIGGDKSNSRGVLSTETAPRAASERSDSLDADVSVHPDKALTVMSSSVGSNGSRDSTSLTRNKRGSTTNATGATTTRRKAGHQVTARPARPLIVGSAETHEIYLERAYRCEPGGDEGDLLAGRGRGEE